jgi:hypothetical protein
MKKIINIIVIVVMVAACVPAAQRKASSVPNLKPDDKTLYDYAFLQFIAHIKEKHNCEDVKLIDRKLVTRDDMVISEKWTAEQCGKTTEHIVIRGSDNYGEMVVGVGDLDDKSIKDK